MSFKVVRNNGVLVCYGPNDDNYEPALKTGELLTIEENKPLAVETAEQTIARLEGALDKQLDEVAKEYRYESIRTMVTYATSEHPDFGKEGRAAVAYRDAVYAYGIQFIADVQNGLRDIPTEAELIDELPPFTDFLQAA